jgi:hypothetical protein
MIFRKIPFALWIVGTLILMVDIYLINTLAMGHFGVFKPNGKKHKEEYALNYLYLYIDHGGKY